MHAVACVLGKSKNESYGTERKWLCTIEMKVVRKMGILFFSFFFFFSFLSSSLDHRMSSFGDTCFLHNLN